MTKMSMIADVQVHFLEQLLDHFDTAPLPPNISAVLFQRYFYSTRFVSLQPTMSNQYAFLCVGGEGPALDQSVLVDSVHCTGDMLELAQRLHEEHGASVHLFALEHRYYGQSYPIFINTTTNGSYEVPPTTNDNLQWLSSKQAQYDLRAFVLNRNQQFQPSLHHTKWVTFGGSYPGMMAAWARALHPDLIHAAVSSSAPVHMTLNFHGYLDRVAWDLQYERIGGSQQCYQIVKDGHLELSHAIQNVTNHATIANLFGLCDASSLQVPMNVELFIGDGVIMVPAQSNDPMGLDTTTSMAVLCHALVTANGTPMEALAMVAQLQQQQQQNDHSTCITLDWNATLDLISKNTMADEENGLRSWLWQTCTEFGFYATCEMDSQCPFGRGYHEIDQDFQVCEQCFGVVREDVVRQIEETRQYYKLYLNESLSRVLSVNGDVDPWSVLAQMEEKEEDDDAGRVSTRWVYGASHHYWTHPVQSGDDTEIQNAREWIYKLVMKWLDEPSEQIAEDS